MKKLIAILFFLPSLAFAQALQSEPTGMDRLALKLAQAELDAARYFDEINLLKKHLATMREIVSKREHHQEQKKP